MQRHDLHFLWLVLLVAAALGLGLAFLQLDSARVDTVATATAAPGMQPAAAPARAGASHADAPAPRVDPPATDGQLVADQGDAAETETIRTRGGVDCETPHLLVDVPRDTAIHATPGGRRIATLPARTKYLDQPVIAWVQQLSADGGWGKVTLPWSKPVTRAGWIRLEGLPRRTTTTMVVADLSERRLVVYRRCRAIETARTAIGREGSPSPTGRFWVSDRVQVPAGQRGSFGSFAFGMSTVQPNLPAGWTGGDQMAVHGTGAPGSIGQAASAGCLRVGEDALRRLKPLLLLGTPIVVQP